VQSLILSVTGLRVLVALVYLYIVKKDEFHPFAVSSQRFRPSANM
jgi:hypothetical protein